MITTVFKRLVLIFLACLLFTGNVFAQRENPGIINTQARQNNAPANTLAEELTFPARKPDICGEIIFDATAGEYPITLAEALSIVLDKNFDVKIFTEAKNRDKWVFYESVTDWLPDITYEYMLLRIDGTFLVGGVVPIQVNEVPIESNFLLDYNISAKKYFRLKETLFEFKSQKKELEFTREEVLLRTTRNYYELLRDKLNIEILKTNIEQIKEQLRINQSQLEAGIGTKFDVLRAEADLALAEQELIAAKNRYRLAQAKLANTLGVPVLFQLVPDEKDVFIKETFEDCFTLEHARMIALSNRPDLSAQQFNVEAARQRRNSGYSVYIPEINVIGQLAQQGTARSGIFPNSVIGFRADWFGLDNLGFKGFTQVKALTAQLREEQFKYINKARGIEEDLVTAYFTTIAARDLIKATDRELNSAKESRRLSVLRLESGVGTFIDVLQAQSTFTTARINNLRAIVGYNISQAELLFQMGVISANNVLEGFRAGAYKQNPNLEKAREYNKKIKEEFENAKQDEFKRQKKQTETR